MASPIVYLADGTSLGEQNSPQTKKTHHVLDVFFPDVKPGTARQSYACKLPPNGRGSDHLWGDSAPCGCSKRSCSGSGCAKLQGR